MNYITTDEGDVIPAIGQDGSDARIRTEWTGEIKKANRMFENGVRELDAECLMIEHFKVNHPGFEWVAMRVIKLSKYYQTEKVQL